MLEFLQYQHQTSQFYSDLMSKLERMNSTMGSMQRFLDSMQRRVEERLHSIQGYLGWAGTRKKTFSLLQAETLVSLFSFPVVLVLLPGLSLTAMWTCVAHLGYFVVCAVLLSFLRCPAFPRAALLLCVPLNGVAEVHQQPSLDLANLSVLLLALSLGTAATGTASPVVVCRSLGFCLKVTGWRVESGRASPRGRLSPCCWLPWKSSLPRRIRVRSDPPTRRLLLHTSKFAH